jgi:hypothetical protein
MPRRRWLHFSIRTLLVAVTIFCVWLGYYANWQLQRAAAVSHEPVVWTEVAIHEEGEISDYVSPIPLGLRLVGVTDYRYVKVTENCSQSDVTRLVSLFPEAIISPFAPFSEDKPLTYPPDGDRLTRMRSHSRGTSSQQ